MTEPFKVGDRVKAIGAGSAEGHQGEVGTIASDDGAAQWPYRVEFSDGHYDFAYYDPHQLELIDEPTKPVDSFDFAELLHLYSRLQDLRKVGGQTALEDELLDELDKLFAHFDAKVPTGRPKIGDYVRILNTEYTRDCSREAWIGQIGRVEQDDEDDRPFFVLFDEDHGRYFDEDSVEKVTGAVITTTRYVLVSGQ